MNVNHFVEAGSRSAQTLRVVSPPQGRGSAAKVGDKIKRSIEPGKKTKARVERDARRCCCAFRRKDKTTQRPSVVSATEVSVS